MNHGSGSIIASAVSHDSLDPPLTPKQYMQVNKSAESKTGQRNGNGTTINETVIKRTKSRESKVNLNQTHILQ